MKGLILVHGGAGPMRSMSGEREQAYRDGMGEAARAGREALARGEGPLAAVVVATRIMEATGAFNAGCGSCLDADGRYALDAALMRGADRAAGAVAAMTAALHPTDLCLDLLEEGRHVLLAAEGADRRSRRLGLTPLPPPPPDKLETYARMLAARPSRLVDLATVGRPDDEGNDPGQDTVGAVAVDADGRVAASVSTGGLWLKEPGRVGDSAVLGAGLFACDELGAAASATGIGERMLRGVTSYLACLRAGDGDAAAGARAAVDDLARRFGADSGGVVVIDRQGRCGVAFNTSGMGRALARVGEDAVPVAVWPEDPFPV